MTDKTTRPHTRRYTAPSSHDRNLGKFQRCSRPLCSSQATDEPTRQPAGTTTRQAGRYTHNPMTRALSETLNPGPDPQPATTRPRRNDQPPTFSLTPRPVASGPNSVLSKPPPQQTQRSNPQEGVLTSSAARTALRQCSTHEQPPQTRTAWAWPLPPAPTNHPEERRPVGPAGVPGCPGAWWR